MRNETAIARFKTNLHGDFIQPGDPRYEEARKVFNGIIEKRPAMIVRCADVADTIAAVNFALETNVPLAVRGGGHGVTGNALCDGGLVIDLSEMKRVQVDPDSRIAHAEGGTTWGDFDQRNSSVWLGHDRRHCTDHWNRGPYAGWRHRVPQSKVWPRLRQPA
jgi:hypothetical protein